MGFMLMPNLFLLKWYLTETNLIRMFKKQLKCTALKPIWYLPVLIFLLQCVITAGSLLSKQYACFLSGTVLYIAALFFLPGSKGANQ